jgi:hypothetical protein
VTRQRGGDGGTGYWYQDGISSSIDSDGAFLAVLVSYGGERRHMRRRLHDFVLSCYCILLPFGFLRNASTSVPRHRGIDFYCSTESRLLNFTGFDGFRHVLEDITHLSIPLHNDRALAKIRSISQSISTDHDSNHEIIMTIDGNFSSTVIIELDSITVYVNHAAWTNWYPRTCKLSRPGSRWCCAIIVEGISPGATRLELSIDGLNDGNSSDAAVSSRISAREALLSPPNPSRS